MIDSGGHKNSGVSVVACKSWGERVWSREENAGRVQQVEFYLVLLLNLFNALFNSQFGGDLFYFLNLHAGVMCGRRTVCDC